MGLFKTNNAVSDQLFLEAHLLIIFSAFGEAESLLLEKRQLVEEIDTMNRLRH